MNDRNSRYTEHAVIYALLGLAAAIWLGFGGLVFVGILQNASGA
jgi:hypothetical protein